MFGIDDAIATGLKIVDKYIPDGDAREKAKEDFRSSMLAAFAANDQGQLEVAKIEAGHSSVFVAGYRPFIGWVCGVILALYYIPFAVVSIALWSALAWRGIMAAGDLAIYTLPAKPEIGIGDVIALLGTLLGIAGMRSFDKYMGTDATDIAPKKSSTGVSGFINKIVGR